MAHAAARSSTVWAVGLSLLAAWIAIVSSERWTFWLAVAVLLLADVAGVASLARGLSRRPLPLRKRVAAVVLGTVPIVLTVGLAGLLLVAWIAEGTA